MVGDEEGKHAGLPLSERREMPPLNPPRKRTGGRLESSPLGQLAPDSRLAPTASQGARR